MSSINWEIIDANAAIMLDDTLLRLKVKNFVPDPALKLLARYVMLEQTVSAGYLMGLESNKIVPTEEKLRPYTAALNKALWNFYSGLKSRSLYFGKIPQRSFNLVNAKGEVRKCDDRCRNARGPICECPCGGLGHGMNVIGVLAPKRKYVSIAPGM